MVRILADSTCDLSKELLSQYSIDIIPLQILLGDREYEDGCGVKPADLFSWSDENKTSPKTAACRQETAMAALDKHIAAGDEVICFTISEHMSCTANVIRMAAQALEAADRVTVVDSANLSTGNGLLVLHAAEMAQQGASRAEIVKAVEKMKPRVRASFVVDTLTYLHRGGRCSGVAALLGGTLRLHPCISVVSGKMEPGKKYRGKMGRGIASYVEDIMPALLKADPKRVFITHAACSDEIVQSICDRIRALNRFEEILVTEAGCVISSHCGPGTLGVLFVEA